MVILERYVSPEGLRLRIGGVVTRDVAHYQGVPHGAAQVAVVALKESNPHVLVHKRSPRKKTDPDKWDICGGHIDADKEISENPNIWDDQDFITDLFAETALREAKEEVRIIPRPDFEFREEHIKCFGGFGIFECGFDNPGSENREHSAFYVAFVPKNILALTNSDKVEKIKVEEIFEVRDTDREGEAKAGALKLLTLSELLDEFNKNPIDYADGITRVLSRVKREPGTRRALVKFLDDYYV